MYIFIKLLYNSQNTSWKLKELKKVLGYFLIDYKDFEVIQPKLGSKKIHEVIFVFDLLNKPLSLKL